MLESVQNYFLSVIDQNSESSWCKMVWIKKFYKSWVKGRDLQTFQVFSQYPKWVIESAVNCFNKINLEKKKQSLSQFCTALQVH